MCSNGYVGNPLRNSQCYKQQELNKPSTFTLPRGQATFVAVGRDLVYPNFDAMLSFVVIEGEIEVYISTESTAVKVIEDSNSFQHRIIIPDGVNRVSRTRGDHVTRSEDHVTRHARELQSDYLPSSENSPLFHYQVDERLTLIVSHDQPEFERAFHFITVYAQDGATFILEFSQNPPQLNLYIFFGLFFSTVALMSSLLIGSWKLFRVIVEARQAALEKQLRESRANRPLYDVTLYLHDGEEHTGEVAAVDSAQVDASSKKHEYQAVEERLRSKSVLILEDRPTYITKRRKRKNETPRNTSSNLRNRNKKSVTSVDPSEIQVWPITMQPTSDLRASVHSVVVQLPSAKSFRHALCVGSTLVRHSAPKANRKKSQGQRGNLAERASRYLFLESGSGTGMEQEMELSERGHHHLGGDLDDTDEMEMGMAGEVEVGVANDPDEDMDSEVEVEVTEL